MAKLLAYYSLCPINSIDDFLGLSRDVKPGCVINTLGRNIILVVKLSNQRQMCSWTVLERLSSKVVYDFKSERYVAVFGGRYLRCWELNRPDVNTVKKIKLYRTVLDLLTLANGETLVLYNDGTCESLESALETKNLDKSDPDVSGRHKGNVDPLTHTIRDVQVFSLDDGTSLLTYFVRREEDGAMELNYALLNKTDLKVRNMFEKVTLERRIGGDGKKLTGCCIVDGTDGPGLISVWSDGRIFYLPLSLGQSPKRQEGVGNFVDMVRTIDVDQPMSMISIGKDYIAMYSGNTNQDGATLALYNVQVKVFQAKQYFKVYFNASRFWVIESNILLAFGHTLSVVPFKISKEQLSDMIGSQCTTFDLSHSIDDESLNEEGEFFDAYSYDGTLPTIAEHSTGAEVDENDPEVEQLVTKNRYCSVEVYEHHLRHAYQQTSLPLDIIADDTLPEDMVQLKLFNNADPTLGPLVFSQKFEIIAEEMERSGCSEQEICGRLVPWLVRANLPNDLAKCMKRYSVISESTIVKALNYALDLPEETHDETKVNGGDVAIESATIRDESLQEPLPDQNVFVEAQYEHPSHRDLLNIVLSCSFNSTDMIPYVRSGLSFPKVMQLLQHLEYLLVDPMATLSENLHSGDTFDSDEKTVEWIMVLLDAHYQQFILSVEKGTQEQIQRMLRIVDEHMDCLRQLKNLAPTMLQLMERKNQKHQSGRDRLYNIETIELY